MDDRLQRRELLVPHDARVGATEAPQVRTIGAFIVGTWVGIAIMAAWSILADRDHQPNCSCHVLTPRTKPSVRA